MKKSYALACSLMLLAVPDSVRGQEPSQAIRARPEHMRAVIPLGDLQVGEPLFRVRLMPREPASVDVEANAIPKLPHYLRFSRFSDVWSVACLPSSYSKSSTTDPHVSGCAESTRSGSVTMHFSLVPGQLYLLDIRIESAGLTLELRSTCHIDGLQQDKIFPDPAGPAQLLAVIERPASVPSWDRCGFVLSQSPPSTPDGSWTTKWVFFSAEITRLSNQ